MKRNRLMGAALVLLSFSALNSFADNGSFEFYPTERNARAFIDQYCKGLVNDFKLKSDKRPRLVNSCFMFGIVAGDRDLTHKMLDRGASPLTYWTSDMHYKTTASWPDDKGQLLDENSSSGGLSIAFANLLSGSIDQAMREYGEYKLDPSGLGFSALTLAIEKNDTQMVQELISRDKDVLTRGDGLGRCPLTYAILLKRDAIVQQLLAQKSPALTCESNIRFAQNVQEILADGAPNSILHREDKALWMDQQSSTPVLAAYRVGNKELALYIADRINKVPAGDSQLQKLLAVAIASKDPKFVDRLLGIRSSLAPVLLETAMINDDLSYIDMAVKYGVDTKSNEAYTTLVTRSAQMKAPEKAQAFISSLINTGYAEANEVSRRLMDAGKIELALSLAKDPKTSVSDATKSALLNKAMEEAIKGNLAVLKKAQEAGIADAQSLSKMGALQMALRARNSDLADLLLSMGVDPNGRTGGWALPIEWVIATYPDGDSYLQKAMDAGMSPCLKTSSDDSLLVSAANAGKVAYLLQLQDIIQSSSPEEMGKILIGLVKSDEVPAAKFIQIMDKMIAQGLKPAAVKDSKGRNLLMALAGSRCEPKLVEYLVRNGVSAADTNEDGKSTADQAYLTASQDIFGKYTKYSCDTPELSRVTNACVRQISMLTQNGSDFSYDPVFNRNCKTSNYQVASVRIQIPLNRSDSSQGYSTQPSYNPYPSQARRQQPTHQSQRSDDDDGDSEMKAPGIVTNRDGSVEINGVKFGGQSGCTETVTIINGNVNRSKVCN